jgi:hypothetical protein
MEARITQLEGNVKDLERQVGRLTQQQHLRCWGLSQRKRMHRCSCS